MSYSSAPFLPSRAPASAARARLWAEFRTLAPVAVGALVFAAAIFAVAIAGGAYFGVPITTLTRDPVAELQGAPYTGIVSNLGVLLWAGAATLCFFAASLLRPGSEARRFFLFGGALTAALLVDDLFLLHEAVAPIYLGVPEKAVHLGNGLLTLGFLYACRGVIMRTEPLLVMMALGLFGLSVVVDQLLPLSVSTALVVEDGAKLAGITVWLAYFARAARRALPGAPA
ncbi:MAG TPA: hypothetical protein VE913_10675 [Longimicrobium sp.]|nr:hypothetical protein [Longimicrobium sp.]